MILKSKVTLCLLLLSKVKERDFSKPTNVIFQNFLIQVNTFIKACMLFNLVTLVYVYTGPNSSSGRVSDSGAGVRRFETRPRHTVIRVFSDVLVAFVF